MLRNNMTRNGCLHSLSHSSVVFRAQQTEQLLKNYLSKVSFMFSYLLIDVLDNCFDHV